MARRQFLCTLAFAAAAAALAQDPNPKSAQEPPMTGAAGDQMFAEKAAIGNMAEVEAGRIALQNSSNEKMKAFDQQLVTDHTKAGEEREAAASQEGITIPAAIDPEHQAALDHLKGLSGDQFDAAFKEHTDRGPSQRRGDVREGGDFRSTAVDKFAAKTLPTLKKHLKMAEELPGPSPATSHPELRRSERSGGLGFRRRRNAGPAPIPAVRGSRRKTSLSPAKSSRRPGRRDFGRRSIPAGLRSRLRRPRSPSGRSGAWNPFALSNLPGSRCRPASAGAGLRPWGARAAPPSASCGFGPSSFARARGRAGRPRPRPSRRRPPSSRPEDLGRARASRRSTSCGSWTGGGGVDLVAAVVGGVQEERACRAHRAGACRRGCPGFLFVLLELEPQRGAEADARRASPPNRTHSRATRPSP